MNIQGSLLILECKCKVTDHIYGDPDYFNFTERELDQIACDNGIQKPEEFWNRVSIKKAVEILGSKVADDSTLESVEAFIEEINGFSQDSVTVLIGHKDCLHTSSESSFMKLSRAVVRVDRELIKIREEEESFQIIGLLATARVIENHNPPVVHQYNVSELQQFCRDLDDIYGDNLENILDCFVDENESDLVELEKSLNYDSVGLISYDEASESNGDISYASDSWRQYNDPSTDTQSKKEYALSGIRKTSKRNSHRHE